MVHSSPTSCSSSACGADSDDDELECSEDMLSSEPITPTTSICSSSTSSDPFFEESGVQAHVAKFAGNQTKYLPPPQPSQVQMQYYQQHQLPQYQQTMTTQSAAPTPGNGVGGGVGVHNWHMQVVPPSAEQSSYRS
jgi:hypothetical protein